MNLIKHFPTNQLLFCVLSFLVWVLIIPATTDFNNFPGGIQTRDLAAVSFGAGYTLIVVYCYITSDNQIRQSQPDQDPNTKLHYTFYMLGSSVVVILYSLILYWVKHPAAHSLLAFSVTTLLAYERQAFLTLRCLLLAPSNDSSHSKTTQYLH